MVINDGGRINESHIKRNEIPRSIPFWSRKRLEHTNISVASGSSNFHQFHGNDIVDYVDYTASLDDYTKVQLLRNHWNPIQGY